jgi:hypothetical protein
MTRRLLLLIGVGVTLAVASFAAGAVARPCFVQAAWIRLTVREPWARQNRLGKLVEIGMTPEQVRSVLGPPTRAIPQKGGVAWIYWDGRRCAGYELVVHLYLSRTVCYVHQNSEAKVIGPRPDFYTVGQPLAP